jgi:hypothetical protein
MQTTMTRDSPDDAELGKKKKRKQANFLLIIINAGWLYRAMVQRESENHYYC